MDKSEIRTMLKLVRYMHPGREKLWTVAIYWWSAEFILSFSVHRSIIMGKPYGIFVFLFLLIMIVPLFTAYVSSGDFRSLIRRAEDRKALLYDFKNSGSYIGDEVRLGEIFLFPRKGEKPVRYGSICQMGPGWVSGKGYGIVITLNGGGKIVVSERGALPLTRGEGRERYRPFIRELHRRNPGITYEFGEDESKCPYTNRKTEPGQKTISGAETEMWEYLRPTSSTLKIRFLFFLLIVFYFSFPCILCIYTWIPDSDTYLDPPVLRVLFTLIYISFFAMSAFAIYRETIESLVYSRDFELRMKSWREEGPAEEMIKDFHNSVPYLDSQLRFGKKYLFPRQTGKIYEYSGITEVQHDHVMEAKGSSFLYKITEKGEHYQLQEGKIKITKEQCIINLKPGFLNGLSFDKYCLPADEELRKKNPRIVFAPWRN